MKPSINGMEWNGMSGVSPLGKCLNFFLQNVAFLAFSATKTDLFALIPSPITVQLLIGMPLPPFNFCGSATVSALAIQGRI